MNSALLTDVFKFENSCYSCNDSEVIHKNFIRDLPYLIIHVKPFDILFSLNNRIEITFDMFALNFELLNYSPNINVLVDEMLEKTKVQFYLVSQPYEQVKMFADVDAYWLGGGGFEKFIRVSKLKVVV